MEAATPTGLSRRQMEFLAIGGAIGAGLFLGAGQGIHLAGPSVVLAYAVAGMMVFIVARALAEMALSDARPAVFVSYTARYLGARAGFVQGWSYWFCVVMVCTAEITAAGVFLRFWLPGLPQWLSVSFGLLVLFGVNRLHVRVFGAVEFWMSLVKVAAILCFLLLAAVLLLLPGPMRPAGASIANLWPAGGPFPNGFAAFLGVMPLALFSFGGTELIGIAAAEAEEPARSLPRAVNGLLLRISLFYVGTTVAILCLMPWSTVPADSSPIVRVLGRVGIPFTAGLMNLVVTCAVLSSCNAMLYGSSRILRSLAQIGDAPRGFSALNRHGTPGRAVGAGFVTVAVLTVLLNAILPDTVFQLLLATVAVTVVVNWAIILVTHLRFRGRGAGTGRSGRFPVPAAPWSSLVVLALVAATLAAAAANPGLRAALLLAGAMFALLTAVAWVRAIGVGRRSGSTA